MEEINKLWQWVITEKHSLGNDILKECGTTSESNTLVDDMAQIKLSAQQTNVISDSDSDYFSHGRTDQSITSNETVNNDKQQIFEQFRSGEHLDFDKEQTIVNEVNQYLISENIRILRDDAHNNWACLKYCQKKRSYQIKFYTQEINHGWGDSKNARQKLIEEINAWLPNLKDENPISKFQIICCSTTNDPAKQFLFVLLYAFGCALGVEESFLNPTGDKPIITIREIICDALSNGLEEGLPKIKEIWSRHSTNPRKSQI